MEALDDELLQQADERLSLTQKLRLVWTQPKRVFTAVVTSNQDFESFLLLSLQHYENHKLQDLMQGS